MFHKMMLVISKQNWLELSLGKTHSKLLSGTIGTLSH